MTERARRLCIAVAAHVGALALALLAATPAAAEPRNVRFGGFVTSISGLDPSDGSFRISAYVWTVDPAGTFDPASGLQIIARELHITDDSRMTLPDGSLYIGATVNAVIDHGFDMSDYPFERDTLTLTIESDEDSSRLVFVPDQADSRIADFVDLPGWHIDGVEIRAGMHTYQTRFGHWSESPTFSRLRVGIDVSRNRSPLFLGKFTGFLVAFLITAMVFAVPPAELGIRVGMTTSSIFAAVFNRYRLEDAIGFDAVFGLVDQVTVLIFSAILWTLVLSVVSHRMTRRQLAAWHDRRLGGAIVLAHLLLLGAAFAAALR